MTDNQQDLAFCVEFYAGVNSIPLRRRPLATYEEVMQVVCPRHGETPCIRDNGKPYLYGCLDRQVQALRADERAPMPETACGPTGEDAT